MHPSPSGSENGVVANEYTRLLGRVEGIAGYALVGATLAAIEFCVVDHLSSPEPNGVKESVLSALFDSAVWMVGGVLWLIGLGVAFACGFLLPAVRFERDARSVTAATLLLILVATPWMGPFVVFAAWVLIPIACLGLRVHYHLQQRRPAAEPA